jgi:hypothetical protein
MFRAILNNSPTWYTPYILGNNYIQYNPSSSCGGSNVYIQNRATQALYNYTPYQPNQAALDAGWGSATCGAYGNRNFYLYFTKWFGATTSAATYTYEIVSKELYSDSNYQNKISNNEVEPNQTFYAKVAIKNTSNQTWYSENLHLGTTNPSDHTSPFATAGWLGSNRPAAVDEDSVGAGETATFKFPMKAPAQLGHYTENYAALIEGNRWLDGPAVELPIYVNTTSPYYSAQTTSFKTFLDQSMTYQVDPSKITSYTDATVYVRLTIKNTGNQTLSASTTKVGTTNPLDHAGIFKSGNWLSDNRATTAKEGDIAPGQTGTYDFTLTLPSIPSSRTSEQYGVVVEDIAWLDENAGSVSIQTNQHPPTELASGQALNTDESLVSDNGLYRLTLQGDGNLVLYSPSGALWASWTMGKGATRLFNQSDGNLVLYTASWRPVWDSKTNGHGLSRLVNQDDGNLVSYTATQQPTWATWTNKR